MTRRYFDWAATAVPLGLGTWDLGLEYRFPFPSPQSPVPSPYPYGNPSSPHTEGRRAREALESARARCAAVLDVPQETVYFTSGGTESNAIVIFSQLLLPGRGRILYSAVEHPAVRENCLRAERLGKPAAAIAVERDGRVSLNTLERALAKHADARFAAIMAVNNETGAINPLGELSALIRSRPGPPIHLHSDLVQAVGKIPLDIRGWDLDSASLSAHKLGGPRGIGILYLKKPLEPLYTGGEQERGVRPGTENTPGALALAEALERTAGASLAGEVRGAKARWKRLITALKGIPRCSLIPLDRGEEDERFSPWILQAGFRDIPGEVMTRALDDAGFAVSTGSACSSHSPERPVLAAMGISGAASLEGIRISQGWSTTMEDIDALVGGVKKVMEFL